MQENPGYEAEFSRKIDWGLNLREGYTSRTFSNASPWRNSKGFWKWVNPGLIRRVTKGPYDAVYVHGHNNFTHLAAIVAARLTGKRTIIRADTYNLGSRSLLKRLARRLVYTLTFRLAHVLLYVGELNRRCFEDFGGRPEQLVHAPQVVDNARFAGEWAHYAPRCGSLKLAFGIAPRQKVCIFCGKFIASKQPLVLLEAFLDANLGDHMGASDGGRRTVARPMRSAGGGAGRHQPSGVRRVLGPKRNRARLRDCRYPRASPQSKRDMRAGGQRGHELPLRDHRFRYGGVRPRFGGRQMRPGLSP